MKNNTYFSDVIPYLVDYYNQFETLPTKAIECTKTGDAYTCFGSNLQNKVEKAGGIEKLLSNFQGRGAKKAQKVEATIEKRTKKKIQVVDTVTGNTTEVLA
jgi:hypothetical protein